MSEIIAIEGGKIIGIRTSIFTIFNVEKYDPLAIPTAWKKFFSLATGLDLANSDAYYGASIPSMDMNSPMDYFAGALVDSSTALPDGFESVDIPAGNYLRIVHNGPIANLAASYQKAYLEALGASGREMRSAPHLEIYDPQLDPMSAEYEMIIAVPIQ